MNFGKIKIILVVFSLLFLTFCYANVFAAEVKLIWSTENVSGDANVEAMKVFKEEVEKLSGGRIIIDNFFGSQIYTGAGAITSCIEGSLDMTTLSETYAAEFIPYLDMFGSAFFFKDYDHMRRVWDSEIGKKIFEDITKEKELGLIPLGVFYLGTKHLNLIEKVGPVRKPEDMKGVKLRTPPTPGHVALGKALGASPCPMAFQEIYMALKTGTIDGQENPLLTIKNTKFYEVTKYIVLTGHKVTTTLPVINKAKWESLSEPDQSIIRIAMKKAEKFCAEVAMKSDTDLVNELRELGMIIIEDIDKDAWIKYAKWSYLNESKDISKDWDMDFYEQIQALK